MEKANPFLKNPFYSADVTMLVDKFRLPGMEVEALTASQRKNMEAVTAVGQLAFEGFQSLAKRQAELAKSCFESYTKGANALIGAETPEEKASKQANLVESLFKEMVSNLNELTDLTTKSADAIVHVVQTRFSEGLDEFREAAQTQKPAAAKAPAAKSPYGKTPAKF